MPTNPPIMRATHIHTTTKPIRDALEGSGISSPANVTNMVRFAAAVEGGKTHGSTSCSPGAMGVRLSV